MKTFSSNSSTKTLLFYLLKKYKRNTKGNNYFSSSCPLYNYYYFLPTSSALSVRYNPGTNYFQILSTFCSSLGLSHYDWPEYIRDQPYTQSPRTKYLFWQTSIFLLLNESLASRSQASDSPLLGTESIRKTPCTHYIISWKEEVGPSDGFCSKLLTLWRVPVTWARSKRLQFPVSCLLRKYKFYFYLKLSVSSSSPVAGPGSGHNKGSSWLVILVTTIWAPEHWWDWWGKLCPVLVKTFFYIKPGGTSYFLFRIN